MACLQKNSGQGAYRNGRKPNLHQGVPGVDHYKDKRRFSRKNKTLQSSIAELRELTKEWVDFTEEELQLWADENWHDLDLVAEEERSINLEEQPLEGEDG